MRIAILHNTYQQAGGEDVVAANEEALLQKFGHEVQLHRVSNHVIQGLWRKAVTAWETPYSDRGRREAMQIIKKTRPDVVHVHNFFPLLTPAIYDACRQAGTPVVQTLHNYRTICPGALLMRDGKPCEDCIQGTPYHAVLHGCYRGSRLGSLAVARMVDAHRRWGTWTGKVDRFIALTQFAKEKFVDAGFPSQKITVKPNFVENAGSWKNEGKRNGALFVGRLSEEKGIETLLRAWKGLDVPLRIVGDGPMLDIAKENLTKPVAALLGRKKPTQVIAEMNQAAFLVMPSEWYEGFPMTIVEAFARGLPVIASRLGAMEEIVEDKITGLHFSPGDAKDLAEKIRWAHNHPEAMATMGLNAQRVYEEKYTADINYHQLMAVYKEIVEENRQNKAGPRSEKQT